MNTRGKIYALTYDWHRLSEDFPDTREQGIAEG